MSIRKQNLFIMNLKKQASKIFKSTLKHVNPREFLPEILSWNHDTRTVQVYDNSFQIPETSGIYIIGAGKASPTMATACEKIFSYHLDSGMIIAPPGSTAKTDRITMLEGSHPLPDDKSFHASKQLLAFIDNIPENSTVINILSGGTSSLLCLPCEGIEITELRDVYALLLQSGATIHEVNTVRKTLSRVKGGKLLDHLKQSTVLDIVISDVPDDDLRYIGSGPTTAQSMSYKDAYDVAVKYDIWNRFPDSVRNHISEHLHTDDLFSTTDFTNHHAWIVSSASRVAKRTKELLTEEGFETDCIHPAWTGRIDDFEGKIFESIHQKMLRRSGKRALVFYGECTVKVTGDGLGGRNQELALRLAGKLRDVSQNIAFLSAGTDGIDGPTDAAGAVVDQNTWKEAEKKNLDPESFIKNNDSYHFFKEAGGHIFTGPTGNNVMDIQIVLMA